MRTVCLFDIDGTLLNTGGAGQHAMEVALAEVFNVHGPYNDIPAAGRTDWAITRDLFAFHKLDVEGENWDRFLSAYLKQLPVSISSGDGLLLPGVIELLTTLHERDDVVLGLLTGNLEIAAQLKLKHFDIDHFFHFGGYGDQHLDRNDVAALALNAAQDFYVSKLSRGFDAQNVWVIGDTPADVRCGRAIGAKVLAVATGIHSHDELEQSNPDHLRRDLSETAAVIELLSN